MKTVSVEAKNQLPLVSVSLQDIWFPPLRSVTAALTFTAAAAPAQPGRPSNPPEALPLGTKMSLSLVFAPARLVEEMAEALPVRLQRGSGQGGATVRRLLALKQAQHTVFKANRWRAREVNKRGPAKLCSSCEGLFLCGGRWEMRAHKEASQEDVVWRRRQVWTTLNVRFFCPPLPPERATSTAPPPPPARGLTMRKLFRRDEGH